MVIFCCLKVLLGLIFLGYIWTPQRPYKVTAILEIVQFCQSFPCFQVNEAGNVCYVRDVPESASKPPPVQQIARALRPGLRKLQTAVPFPATVNAASDWSETKKDKQLGAREVCEIVDNIYYIYTYWHLYILSESKLTVSYCFVLFHDVLFSWHDLHQILQNMCRMHLMTGCYAWVLFVSSWMGIRWLSC